MLRRYETIFISYADLPDEEITALIDRYSGIVTTQKGTLIKIERWGKRKLAYDINKQSRGCYVLLDYAGSGAIVTELERNLKIGDKILKYMTVKTQDRVNLQEIEKEMAAGTIEVKAEEAPATDQDKPKIQEAPAMAGEDTATPGESEASLPADAPKEEE